MNTFTHKQKQLKEQAAKEAIYEATLKVITHQQGQPLKMQTIAENAGIAIGTLYNYFKNKTELLTYVDERLHTDILARIEGVLDLTVSPPEKLRTVIHGIFAFFSEYHFVFNLMEKFGTKLHVPRADKYGRLQAARQSFARIIEEGVRKGQFRNTEPAVAARYLLYAVIGIIEIQDWLGEYDLDRQADELSDFLLSNLTKEGT